MQIVEAKNTGKKPVTLRHDGLGNVTIPGGKSLVIPLSMALVNFGNPGAKNVGKDKNRDAEVRHVHQWWGFYDGMYSDEAWFGVGTSGSEVDADKNPKKVGPFCPTVELYDPNTSERIWFIHDDPDGTNADSLANLTSELSAEDRIAELERQIAALVASQANARDDDTSTADDEPVDETTDMIAAALAGNQAAAKDGAVSTTHVVAAPDDDGIATVTAAVKEDAPTTTKTGRKGGGTVSAP